MRHRWTRMTLLALLLLALPPGAAVAACMQAGPAECCCADACPKPNETRVDAPSCCEVSDGASLPQTVPATAASSVSTNAVAGLPIAAQDIVSLPTERPARRVGSGTGRSDPVPLFTLHAAYLI